MVNLKSTKNTINNQNGLLDVMGSSVVLHRLCIRLIFVERGGSRNTGMDPAKGDVQITYSEIRIKVAIFTVLVVCLTGKANSENCSTNCRHCGSDGRCLNCTSGYYGVYCAPCSPRCKDAQCLFDLCSEGCEEGSYGYSCDRNCSHCVYGCDQWRGRCHEFPESARKKRPNPSWVQGLYISTEYRILIIILSVSTIAILIAVVIFCKLTRLSRRQFSVSGGGRRRRTKSPRRQRSIHRETTVDTVVWETNSDMTSSQTSNTTCRTATNINMYSSNPTPGNYCGSMTVHGDEPVNMEKEPLVSTSWDVVRIVVSPPSPHARCKHVCNKMRL